jgi:hypothetical protein
MSRSRSVTRERQKPIELARQKPRYGYRRLQALLERSGWRVNHKGLERLYVSGRESPYLVNRELGKNRKWEQAWAGAQFRG